jgi:hypothetical protein
VRVHKVDLLVTPQSTLNAENPPKLVTVIEKVRAIASESFDQTLLQELTAAMCADFNPASLLFEAERLTRFQRLYVIAGAAKAKGKSVDRLREIVLSESNSVNSEEIAFFYDQLHELSEGTTELILRRYRLINPRQEKELEGLMRSLPVLSILSEPNAVRVVSHFLQLIEDKIGRSEDATFLCRLVGESGAPIIESRLTKLPLHRFTSANRMAILRAVQYVKSRSVDTWLGQLKLVDQKEKRCLAEVQLERARTRGAA